MHALTHMLLGMAASATVFTSAIAADLNPAAVAFTGSTGKQFPWREPANKPSED